MIERATVVEIVAWATAEKIALPAKGRLNAINVVRKERGLRPFVVIAPSDLKEQVQEQDYDQMARDAWDAEQARKQSVAAAPQRHGSEQKDKPVDPKSVSPAPRERIISPPLAKQRPENLRDALFQELYALRNGDSDPTQSQAVAKLAAQIVQTYRVENDMAKAPVQIDVMRIADDKD